MKWLDAKHTSTRASDDLVHWSMFVSQDEIELFNNFKCPYTQLSNCFQYIYCQPTIWPYNH